MSKLTLKLQGSIATVIETKLKKATSAALSRAAPKIAIAVRKELVAASKDKLGPQSKVYERGLKDAFTITSTGVSMSIKDPLLKAVEQGAAGWDIKQALLKHGKTGKGGSRYVDVPMLHSQVPTRVVKAIKASGRNSAVTPGKAFTKRVQLGGGKSRRVKVAHGQGIRDGMFAQGTRFLTIRRISSNSPASSWLHRGFKGLKLVEKLEPKLKKVAARAIVSELKAVGIKAKVTV